MTATMTTVILNEQTYFATDSNYGHHETIYLVRVERELLDGTIRPTGLTADARRAQHDYDISHTEILHRAQFDSRQEAINAAYKLAKEHGCIISNRIPTFSSGA